MEVLAECYQHNDSRSRLRLSSFAKARVDSAEDRRGPNGLGGVNQPWLDSIIRQGQSVLVRAGGDTTKREVAYLIEHGYKQIGEMLIPPQ